MVTRFLRRRISRMWHPPRRAIPTRAGIFALGAPIVLGVAAVNASNNLLFMLLGGVLGAIVLSGVLSERNMFGVSAIVRAVSKVYAGEPARLEVLLVREGSKGPAYGLMVAEQGEGSTIIGDLILGRARPGLLTATFPVLESKSASRLAARTFPRRGLGTLGKCELVTRYPFGLLIKLRDLDVDLSVLVRPRRVPVPKALAEPENVASDHDASDKRGIGLELYGLREKEDRDSFQRVHALRSLSLGLDVVIETDGLERPMAWLGLANGEGADQEAFERALEIAQAVLIAWDERGYAVGLKTFSGEFFPNADTLDAMLDHLARLEPSPPSSQGATPPVWIVPEGCTFVPKAGRVARIGRSA